jgi:hypothetical protein
MALKLPLANTKGYRVTGGDETVSFFLLFSSVVTFFIDNGDGTSQPINFFRQQITFGK